MNYFLAAAGGAIAGVFFTMDWGMLACWMGLVFLYITASVD